MKKRSVFQGDIIMRLFYAFLLTLTLYIFHTGLSYANDDEEKNEGLFTTVHFNPVFNNLNPVFEVSIYEGNVPYDAKFVQNVDLGLGWKDGDRNIRYQVKGKWIRFHVDSPTGLPAEIEFAPLPGSVLDQFGITGGAYYDHNFAEESNNEKIFYAGSEIGFMRGFGTQVRYSRFMN